MGQTAQKIQTLGDESHPNKYSEIIEGLKSNKFKNITFITGAGISTSAGIPDFRSKGGLFSQTQKKYNLSSPEQFFQINLFYNHPEYFYDFCKGFNIDDCKPTKTHLFQGFLSEKGILNRIFTQNIDGLELKANIPPEKIIFAHGTFTKGHCPQCKIPVDINKINKGIEEGFVVRCDICGGPCKPNVVFYGEDLGEEFYQRIKESENFDLVFVMGTSMQVYPFAEIPRLMKTSAWKVVFNRDKVGRFLYSFLFSNTLFIQGTTDDSIKKFLKDVELLDDFKNFVKNNYGDDNIDTNENIKMLEVNKMEVENKQENNDIKNNEEIQKDNNNEDTIKNEMKEN